MKNPNPDCERHCKFVYGYSVATAMYYDPVYDKHGNNLCYRDWETDRKSTRLNSSHSAKSRMPSSA